ncbi:MAG: AAA-like domain-containing protein [Spirochaetes bacterium]|nr:AAA-like domain-containing protein [Spirochaetota bacterium]
MNKRYFNIAGPCYPRKHYMIDAAERGGEEILNLIEKEHYFVIHSSRQSGKTTLLWEFTNYLNAHKKYYALYCSLEAVHEFNDPEKGIPEIVKTIKSCIEIQGLPDGFAKDADYSHTSGVLKSALTRYCRQLDKPLVIFFDEADCLSNGTLITFLRQLRDGFVSRGNIPFVHSIALAGMRNIRDYKAQVRPDSYTLGSSSPFNIVTKSITLPAFAHTDIKNLYFMHAIDTKQIFKPEAIEYIFEQTCGQPWLVNAIAREITEEILKNDYSISVTKEMAEAAIQNLILTRPTHFDSLLERLKEPRVRKVIEPLILGEESEARTSDDYLYVKDLGLIKGEKGEPTIPANPIYAEIIVRFLSEEPQESIELSLVNYTVPRYLKAGKMDMGFLLRDFQAFWRENSEIWINRYEEKIFQYAEAAPHLVLQAFLQRVMNGGGQITREMALGSKRADLCIVYDGQKYPIEIKILRNEKTITDGIVQTFEYMEKCGADEGWLVVFDRDTKKSWDEKIYIQPKNYNGKLITVVGA